MIILRNVDAIDRSNEEKEKAGRHESSDSDDLRPCRKAKRTAKIGILKSLTETASDSNGSDFDEDYSVTGAGTKRKPPSKNTRKSPKKPMESKECPICFEKCFNSWVLNNHLVGKQFEARKVSLWCQRLQ